MLIASNSHAENVVDGALNKGACHEAASAIDKHHSAQRGDISHVQEKSE